ncbi:inositol oxygenase 1 [Uncinocarpus reesii 1704]|uniref:Inositol oxygenase n=1 Tax=Uncinocarpus reesii (strain UAMH 1704) TaxID=336963 RepID=C4JJ08_UNCRE|nr:inositol oxygenase 1 [Uncinocarpus reesii 1704]EEP76766.1 inositol oxygenase 1 [Uncinocarpus reesii 1704]
MTPGAIDSVSADKKAAPRYLEELCDEIDKVNAFKALARERSLYAPSEFDKDKDRSQFRQYEEACERVREFYHEQHTKQTVAYNLKARNDFRSKTRARLTVWEAIEKLNVLIDESDPDTELSQIEHLLQSAEAIRRDAKPRWMQLTGLIHDLGKLLYFFGAEGQWDVVGDTFPDQSTLPPEALAMIRYHSFYPWHSAGGYTELMDEHDQDMLEAVRAFNPYDLYSKSDDIPDVEELKPYYLELIDEYFPQKVLRW